MRVSKPCWVMGSIAFAASVFGQASFQGLGGMAELPPGTLEPHTTARASRCPRMEPPS